MSESNSTTTEIDQLNTLFKGGTSSSSRDVKPSGEITMAAQLTAVNAELSRVRKDVEKILTLLENGKHSGTPKKAVDFNLDDYTDLWADLSDEELTALKKSFDEGISFPEAKIDFS